MLEVLRHEATEYMHNGNDSFTNAKHHIEALDAILAQKWEHCSRACSHLQDLMIQQQEVAAYMEGINAKDAVSPNAEDVEKKAAAETKYALLRAMNVPVSSREALDELHAAMRDFSAKPLSDSYKAFVLDLDATARVLKEMQNEHVNFFDKHPDESPEGIMMHCQSSYAAIIDCDEALDKKAREISACMHDAADLKDMYDTYKETMNHGRSCA